MFADKNLLFSKYEQLHNIYIQFVLLFVVCVCATTMYRRFLEYTVFGLKIAVYLKICVILKSKNPLSARLMIVSCINDLVGIQNQLSTMFPETPDFKDPLYLDNSSISCCTVLAKMRSQAFLPLRNEPYDFVVVHAYDDLNKNMTADLNSIHSTVVNSVSEMWIKHKDFQKEQMAVIVSSVKKGSFFTMYITQL